MNSARFPASFLAALLLTALVAGCATRKIDWSRRVGNYTLDQAISELGPPDKQAPLTDGTIVAEWLTSRGYHQVYATGAYYGSPYSSWSHPPTYMNAYSPDYFLRLTFAPEGRLQSWKEFRK